MPEYINYAPPQGTRNLYNPSGGSNPYEFSAGAGSGQSADYASGGQPEPQSDFQFGAGDAQQFEPAPYQRDDSGYAAAYPAALPDFYDDNMMPEQNAPAPRWAPHGGNPLDPQMMNRTLPDYLRSQIGRIVRVEFLIGNNRADKVGRLREVGADYLVLEDANGVKDVVGDLRSVRFVNILVGSGGYTAV